MGVAPNATHVTNENLRDRQTPTPVQTHLPLHHANVRGPDYFH